MWVVIPVKRFVNAKTRLSSLMSESERESLAQVMLNDVLLAVSSSLLVSGILLVSNEVRARYAVERLGGLFLEEEEAGLSASVEQASKWLAKHGQRGMLMIPGDVPLVRSSEIDEIIRSHRGDQALTIVPDTERDGTNALCVSPLQLIKFSFGKASFSKHLAAGELLGLVPSIVNLSGIALDIDNPIDLQILLSFDNETETLAYLADSGIARKVLPRRNRIAGKVGIGAASINQ
jgi:2-phospho-L-lactate guanylyltransferase